MPFALFTLERLETDSKRLAGYSKCLSKRTRHRGCPNYYGDDLSTCGNVKNRSKDKEINSENEVTCIGKLKTFLPPHIFCLLLRIFWMRLPPSNFKIDARCLYT